MVRTGKLKPYRTAAECIDWSLPCPSIFNRKRPLAEATLRRIAKGIMRYVIDNPTPFIVGQGGPIYAGKPVPVTQPLGTLTTENHRAIVLPSIVPVTHQGGDRSESVHEPFRTITAAHRGEKALAQATLQPVENNATLVSAFLNEHANASNQRVMPVDQPLRTVCAQVKGGHFSMVSAALVGVGGRAGDRRPRGLDEPTATTTAKYDVALATAFLEKSFGGNESPGWPLDKPISTVTTQDHHRLVTSNLVKLRGTSAAAATNEPIGTISAQGQHHAEVRAFLIKYYGNDKDGVELGAPLHTIPTHDRFGLVTIQGQDYQIVDIGLRMLAPHELYRAQGFPSTYVIDEIPDPKLLFVDGRQVDGDPRLLPRIALPKSSQVRMCGNSVCPTVAEALIRANFAHEREIARAAA
jgi:DNA (cytosine-5)-methyltransferase 1